MNRDQPIAPKPYDFVAFPSSRPILEKPIGHDRYHCDRLHGALHLTLQVQTALHVSTGITTLGSDVGSRLPLIKTMTTTNKHTAAKSPDQQPVKQLVLQGSSFKGCIRAAYEAITNSTLAVITSRYRDAIPPDRLPCRDREKLCPASRVFGALDWQGLIEFSDAICKKTELSTGFIPSLYSPHPDSPIYKVRNRVAGRKFYYNMTGVINKGENRGIPVQQANRQYTFETVIHYKNLLPEELGILLLILGQDKKYPIALKVGGGKPIGMGTMTATITVIEQSQNVVDRYRDYVVSDDQLTGASLQSFIQTQITAAKNSSLLETIQWQKLAMILKYPGEHEPPEGMY